jgi:hypothetical protein
MNMSKRTMSAVVALAVLMVAGLAMAQPGGGPGGPGGGGPGGGMGGMGGGMGGFDPAEMQKMMDQRNMEQLGATDAQWKTVGPKFTAVQTAVRSINGGGGMGGMRGMGGMGGGRGGMGGMGGTQTDLDKARETLNTTLDDTAATPDKITAAVKAFRDAKEKAKKDLTSKQAELKTAIGNNAKMEARLIAMGMLD